MKKLKRLAAVLLAGIMALALLTACSDSSAPGNPEFEANVEGIYQKALNTRFEKELENGEVLTNDADIKALAIEHIEEKHGEDSLKYTELWKTKGDKKTVVRQVLLCYDTKKSTKEVYVPRFYEAATTQNITLDAMNLFILHKAVETAKAKAKDEGMTLELTALGVGTSTFGGKTYIAIGFELTNTTPQN